MLAHPLIKILAEPLLGPLRIFTHATPMSKAEASWLLLPESRSHQSMHMDWSAYALALSIQYGYASNACELWTLINWNLLRATQRYCKKQITLSVSTIMWCNLDNEVIHFGLLCCSCGQWKYNLVYWILYKCTGTYM